MAAITHARTHDLRPRAAAPALRLVEPVARRRTNRVSPATYRRRRVLVAVVVLGVLLAVVRVAGALGGGPLTAPEPGRLDVRPVAADSYVVQPGDTLWSVARSLEPRGDVRALVDVLVEQRGSAPLQPGERIVLPAAR